MTTNRSGLGFPSFLSSIDKQILCIVQVLFMVASGMAQQSPHASAKDDSSPNSSAAQAQTQNSRSDETAITIPSSTRLPLVLTRPLDSKSTHRGDDIFAQTTDPVIMGNQVVIPAGTFVQGRVEKLARSGTRAEMLMQSVSLVFPNGYIANAGGPANIESDQWTAWNDPTSRTKAAIIVVPLVSIPIGALIGSAAESKQISNFGGMTITTSSHKGLAIGTGVGMAVGLAISFALMAHSHHFYIEAGSPLAMTLPKPVTCKLTMPIRKQRASRNPSL